MTAIANKYSAKGIALLQYVSAAYVAMSGLTSVKVSGIAVETFPSESLDTVLWKTFGRTGFVSPPTIEAEGFFDPVHVTYSNLMTIVTTPVDTNFKVIWPDLANTAEIYNVVAVAGLDKGGAVNEPLKSTIKLQTSGAPS